MSLELAAGFAGAGVLMIVRMIVRMTMPMLVMSGVIVVSVCMTVSMPMTSTLISAAFWLKRRRRFHHVEVQAAQHLRQHVVGFDLQMIGLQVNTHVAVAKVIGGARQVARLAMLLARPDFHHALRRRAHRQKRAIVQHQSVATPHDRATWQKDGHTSTQRVFNFQSALLSVVPIKLDPWCATKQRFGHTRALGQVFVDGWHVGSKTGSSVASSAVMPLARM